VLIATASSIQAPADRRTDLGSPRRQGYEEGVDDRDSDEPAYKRWTAEEVAALQAREPVLSPWRVIAAQACLGALLAVIAGVLTGSRTVAVSALYGSFVAVLPGALMARGATSRLSRLSPVVSAVSMMFWATVKMAASVFMLVLAPRIVPGLSWPAMLIALVVCMQVYWFALLWRGRSKNN